MKKMFGVVAASGILCMALSASAQVVIQDFEAGTHDANLATTWLPSTSGTSTGNLVAGSDSAKYSNEQKFGGALSGKLAWTWANHTAVPPPPPKRIRIQPGATGFNSANNGAVDRTSTPYAGFYLYGAAQNDLVALYMGEAANGGTPYEAFASHEINWNGWRKIEHHVINDPVTGFITGNGTLPATHAMSGLVFYPPTANATTTAAVSYFVDDFAFSATPRGNAGVDNWSIY